MLARFRRALRRVDQRALEDLFDSAHLHTAEAAYAAHPLPVEILLLAMLLEEHKQVSHLRGLVQQLEKGQEIEIKRLRWIGRLFD